MRNLLFTTSLAVFSAVFSATPAVSAAGPKAPPPSASPLNLLVDTQQGPVQGTFSSPTVRQFLGIPFATAPRWAAPQPPPKRPTVFKATKYGDSCVQQIDVETEIFLKLVGGAGLDVTESESCQSLNVWAPSLGRKQKTAVLVWIYGGGFSFGTSNTKAYDGTNFVKNHDDLTIVTFNYRTNIFGQPNAPQLQNSTAGQNFGLLDIDAAIKWVYDNIASFGGDPNRISIFGQSAGAAAADLYTISHPDDNIVKGVILQSGSVAIVSQLSAAASPTGWNAVADAVGCGTNANDEQFRCMQAVPFRTLKDAVVSTNSTFNLVVDGVTVFSDRAARIATGNFLRAPTLGGSTQHEADIYAVGPQLVSPGYTIPGPTQILADALTLVAFTCSAGLSAAGRVKFNVPTWRYQYQGVFPDISTRDDLRAYHASEIPLVFGTFESSTSGIPPTPAERKLSNLMQTVWATFARDPQKGLLGARLGLPLYNPSEDTLIQFGNWKNQSGIGLAAAGNVITVARSMLGAS